MTKTEEILVQRLLDYHDRNVDFEATYVVNQWFYDLLIKDGRMDMDFVIVGEGGKCL